jgi:hypothetical protein
MMAHEIFYVDGFKIVGPYTLEIQFDDGSIQVINFEPMLHGELFGSLQDLAVFNQVKLDPEIRNLVWPNDAAFDPETLRNWPLYADEMMKMAQRWARVPA